MAIAGKPPGCRGLRRATAGDVDPLADLWWATWQATYPPILPPGLSALFHRGLLRSQLEDALATTVVAETAGRPTGFAFRIGNLVDNLWVLPSSQRQGIGSALLDRAARAIAAEGHAFAHLRCIAANHPARAFYRREGWRETRFMVDLVRGEFEVPMVEYQKVLDVRR